MLALMMHLEQVEVCVVEGADGMHRAFSDSLRRLYLPGLTLVARPAGSAGVEVEKVLPSVKGRVAKDGKTSVYICKGGRCLPPVSDIDEALRILKS